MNFSQFAGFYKESLIQMIYENCQQKNQLYNTIAKLSEAIYKKCQKNASDRQIEELLGQLKVMIQYANQDISAHIDLALQQVQIAKRVQLKLQPQIKEKNSSIEEEDEEDQDQEQKPFNQQIRSVTAESEPQQEDLQKQKNNIAKFQDNAQEEKESTQDEDESYSNNETEKFETFKKQQKIFDTVESQNGIKIPQHFRDKNFYFQYTTKGVSFLKMLNKEDLKFIYDLVQIYETQKKVSLIFGVDNRYISKIIIQYKREQGIEVKKIQRNYSGNNLRKSKTTSANQHFQNNNDEGDEDSSISQEQINKEKVFNPFDKETSKESTSIRKVRFQDQQKQESLSKPVNKSALKLDQEKEKMKSQQNSKNNSSELAQKPQKLITVKLEETQIENNNAQSDEQIKTEKKQLVKQPQPRQITNNKDKQKTISEKESLFVTKTNLAHKSGIKEGEKQDSNKIGPNQSQKRLVQFNQQKKQNSTQKR